MRQERTGEEAVARVEVTTHEGEDDFEGEEGEEEV